MWLRMKKTWKLWRNRKFEVPPRACLKFFLYWSIASKKHGFMSEIGNKTKRETLYHSTKSWNPTTILFHHPRKSKRLSKSMRQVFLPKLIWPYIASIHQVQPCLQWKPLEYIGQNEENLLVQLAISLAYPKYLILSLRLCKAQGTKYLIKYLKNAKKGKCIDFS